MAGQRRRPSRVPTLLASLAAALVVAVALAAPAAGQGDTRPRFVVAVLGDSYASGEGSPDVHGRHSAFGDLVAIECTPTPGNPRPCFAETWWSPDSWFPGRDAVFPQQDDPGWQDDARRCHRSSKAPGPQAAMLIADRFPDVRVEVLNFACGGAKIADGLITPYVGAEPPPFSAPLPPQTNALESYVDGRGGGVDAIVMNIGGNDASFAPMVVECLLNAFSNPLDGDCSDNALLSEVAAVTDDATPGAFGTPQASLATRFDSVNRVIRNLGTLPPGAVGLADARPDEVYLTALPNAAHDAPPVDRPAVNPTDLCDGTQTADSTYDNASLGESAAIENVLTSINGAMGRAAQRNGWVFLPGMFEDWRDHGICAEGASFFRTMADAVRFQGDEGLGPFPALGIPIPVSPGVGHPNEAGFANRAGALADVLEEQVRMRFRAPVLTLASVRAGVGYTVSFGDPTPRSLPEFWELEADPPGTGATQRVFSDTSAVGVRFEQVGTSGIFTVDRRGEFVVRVRACRRTPITSPAAYCGPYSNAVTVATDRPGTPTDLRRVALSTLERTTLTNGVKLAWTAGPNTPQSVRYRLHFGKFGGGCTGTTISTCTLLSSSGVVETTATSRALSLPSSGDWGFFVQACSTAGCSPNSTLLRESVAPTVKLATSPVGTFNVATPRRSRAGTPLAIEIGWRTPGRWTDLDRVDLVVRDGRRKVGTVRFVQRDSALVLLSGTRSALGHPDSGERISAGPLSLDLGRSSVVSFGPRARRVVLRLALTPARRLRGRVLSLGLEARSDRGRRQGERVAALVRLT